MDASILEKIKASAIRSPALTSQNKVSAQSYLPMEAFPGIDFGVTEEGMPYGVDAQKLRKSLTPAEMRYLKRLLIKTRRDQEIEKNLQEAPNE